MTQGFFAEILARKAIELADPQRGRFRTFLLAALDHYMIHAHRDAQDAEHRLELEPRDDRSPDREFDRRWALAVLEQARSALRKEFSASGRVELFELLRPHLLDDAEGLPYAEIAIQLNMSVVAVKVTVHRLRQRYGEILRDPVAQTLANPKEAGAEVRHLLEA